jgi:hypothetical protein
MHELRDQSAVLDSIVKPCHPGEHRGLGADTVAMAFAKASSGRNGLVSVELSFNVLNEKAAWTYSFIMGSTFWAHTNLSTWFSTAESQCVVFRSPPNPSPACEGIHLTLNTVIEDAIENGEPQFRQMRVGIPIVLFALCLLKWLPATFLSTHELDHFAALVPRFPRDTKGNRSKPRSYDYLERATRGVQASAKKRQVFHLPYGNRIRHCWCVPFGLFGLARTVRNEFDVHISHELAR